MLSQRLDLNVELLFEQVRFAELGVEPFNLGLLDLKLALIGGYLLLNPSMLLFIPVELLVLLLEVLDRRLQPTFLSSLPVKFKLYLSVIRRQLFVRLL